MAALTEPARKRGLLLSVGVLGGLVMLDETVLGVSLPAIRTEMGLSATTTHWIINAYMLAFTCFAAIGGKAIDLFGLKPALITSCSLFALASLLAGFSDGPGMLITMRVVQGFCAAVMFPVAFAAANLTFDKTERGRAIGTLAGMASVFLASGPLIGGILTDYLSWNWVFWINIPVVTVGCLATCWFWKEPEREVKRIVVDKVGLILLLFGLTGLIFGLMEGPDYGWLTPAIIGSLVTGGVCISAFTAYEANRKAPLIDVRLFQLSAFHASALVILLSQMSKIAVAIFIPHYLQLEMGFSALSAGLATVVAVFPFPVFSAHAGRASDKYGSRRLVLVSMAIIATAGVMLGVVLPLKNYWLLAPILLVWGAALPYTMIPTGRITVNSVPSEKQGEVSGMIITARLVGGTLGVTLGSVLLAMGAGFDAIFWVIGALLAACTAYCFFKLK